MKIDRTINVTFTQNHSKLLWWFSIFLTEWNKPNKFPDIEKINNCCKVQLLLCLVFLLFLFIYYLVLVQSFFSIYETLRDSSMVDFKIIFIEKYFKCRCSNMFFSYYQLLIKRAMETPKSHIKQFWIYNYKTKTCFLKSIEIPTNFQNILN